MFIRNNKSLISVIALVLLLGGAIFCLTKWLSETKDVREAENYISELRESLPDRTVETLTNEDGSTYIEFNPYTPYFLGHDEFFCWMQIFDTPVDYPVARAPEDDEYFYLSHNFGGHANRYGCPFVSSYQTEDDDILYIYGHNNANNSMFGSFVNFNDADYFNEHWSLTLDFADVHREYEIFAVMDLSANNGSFEYWDVPNFNEDRTEENFLNQVISMSAIKRYNGIENLLGSGQYVIMSTCEYTHSVGRRLVIARLINEIPYDAEVNAEIIAREGRA